MTHDDDKPPLDPRDPGTDEPAALDAGAVHGPQETSEPPGNTAAAFPRPVLADDQEPSPPTDAETRGDEAAAELTAQEGQLAPTEAPAAIHSQPAPALALHAPTTSPSDAAPTTQTDRRGINTESFPQAFAEDTSHLTSEQGDTSDGRDPDASDPSRQALPSSTAEPAPTGVPVEPIVFRVESRAEPAAPQAAQANESGMVESEESDEPNESDEEADISGSSEFPAGTTNDAPPPDSGDFESTPPEDEGRIGLPPLSDDAGSGPSEAGRVDVVVAVRVSVSKVEKITRAAVEKATLLAERVVDDRLEVIRAEQFMRDAQMRALWR